MEQLFKVRKNRLDLFKKRRTLPVREPLEAPDNLYKAVRNARRVSCLRILCTICMYVPIADIT